MPSRFVKNFTFALALGLGSTFLVSPTEATATTFAPLSVEQMTDVSDYVIRGQVVEVWTEIGGNGHIWTRARVTVTDVFKGPDSPAELIIDSMGGTYGGNVTSIEGRAVFSEHEELISFLSLQKNGRLVPVGKFLGKYSIRRAPDTDRSHAMRWHPVGHWEFDARFLPHPRPEDRTYLDDLLTKVSDRVETGWDGQPIPGANTEKLEKVNTPLYRTRR